MPIPNPWYIDANARHLAAQQRLLAYSAMEGQEGVLGQDHLKVEALPTPGGSVTVAPGGYSILAKHLSGEFECYVGKILSQETVTINPTTSGGPRTDLVYLRVENPYVSGSGSWAEPADPVNGPYVHVRVAEGVPAQTASVASVNGTWSGIPLARITRPASTGIVQASHIVNLRSIATLGGQRITIIEAPDPPAGTPAPAPPVAHNLATGVVHCSTATTLASNQTAWVDWPAAAGIDVAIPTWADICDVTIIGNPRTTGGNVWGELRCKIGTATPNPGTVFDFNPENSGVIQQPLVLVGGTHPITADQRGKQLRFQVQGRMLDPPNHPGRLETKRGVNFHFFLHFKRSGG